MNSITKVAVVSLVGLLALWLISVLLFGTGGGFAYNTRGYYEGGHMNMSMAVGTGSTLTLGLLLLIKVLFAVFAVAFVIGLIVWVKNNIFTKEDFEAIKNTFSGNKVNTSKEACAACSRELEASWKVCPHCGKEKVITVTQEEAKQAEV